MAPRMVIRCVALRACVRAYVCALISAHSLIRASCAQCDVRLPFMQPIATMTSESKSGEASGKEGSPSKKAAGGPRLATIAGGDASTLNLVKALPMQNVYLATKASNMQDLGCVVCHAMLARAFFCVQLLLL